MEIQFEPEQPPEIADAVARLIDTGDAPPDTWWQAGLDESLADEL